MALGARGLQLVTVWQGLRGGRVAGGGHRALGLHQSRADGGTQAQGGRRCGRGSGAGAAGGDGANKPCRMSPCGGAGGGRCSSLLGGGVCGSLGRVRHVPGASLCVLLENETKARPTTVRHCV